MKNYFGRMGIVRSASVDDIASSIESALQETSDIASLHDAEQVLSDKVTRTYYKRTHLQYEAMGQALECLQSPIAVDTHRWPERLVEFEPVDDELNQI